MVVGEGNQITIVNDTVIEVEPSYLETQYAFSRAWVEDNMLMHTLNQKTIERDTVIQVKEVEKVETNEIVKEVRNPVNWWLVGAVVAMFLGMVFILKIKR
jgi:dolichyl-phosphate-mannose--protein O-mannosyl transferase